MYGKPFNIYKFRTMVHDETRERSSNHMVKENDPLVTNIGKFLRKSHLDELPQIFNVIKGEMSIIGPRPHPVAHAEHYRAFHPQYDDRHRIKPGITGLEQVTTRKRTFGTDEGRDIKARVDQDLRYIDNRNVMTDIAIIFQTLGKVIDNIITGGSHDGVVPEKIDVDAHSRNIIDHQASSCEANTKGSESPAGLLQQTRAEAENRSTKKL